MNYKIQYAPLVLKNLGEIWDYITHELLNLSVAENTVNGIMDMIDGLSEFPDAGARLLFDNGLDSGYRFISYKNFIAFYHMQGDAIYIDRVIYGKRDYMKILVSD